MIALRCVGSVVFLLNGSELVSALQEGSKGSLIHPRKDKSNFHPKTIQAEIFVIDVCSLNIAYIDQSTLDSTLNMLIVTK